MGLSNKKRLNSSLLLSLSNIGSVELEVLPFETMNDVKIYKEEQWEQYGVKAFFKALGFNKTGNCFLYEVRHVPDRAKRIQIFQEKGGV